MIDMKITKDFDLGRVSLDLSKELNDGIDIIADDINKGIEEKQQFGKAFPDNAESTEKKKGFNHPLKDTGLMKDPDRMIKKKATRTRQVAELYPNERRANIAYWNQNGTDRIPRRPFWGISEDAKKRIFRLVERRIDKALRDA
jgi:hypothetical protein